MKYFYVFVLDICFTKYFRYHYPKEIISVIISALPKKSRGSCGGSHTTLIKNGKTYVWGYNNHGQLGLENGINQRYPQELSLYKDIESITCGYDFTLALTSIPNKLYVWGRNSSGELGLGDNDLQYSPKKLMLDIESKIKSITCGESHTITVTESGVCYGWGLNCLGQLGLGDTDNRKSPEEITRLNPGIKKVTCGSHHSVALTMGNVCYTWGSNSAGQLGLGHFASQCLPQELGLRNIIAVACGAFHTIAMTDSKLYSWGSNRCGQLGLGGLVDQVSSPQEIKSIKSSVIDRIISISCGRTFTFALTTFGKLYFWGCIFTDDMELHSSLIPCEVHLEHPVKSICCGESHAMAITVNDQVHTWGHNFYGQLGLGDSDDRSTPCRVYI